MRSDQLFIVGIPTRGRTWDMDASQLILDTFFKMFLDGTKKNRLILQSNRHGVHRARTHILQKLREILEERKIEHGATVRMLWYDIDVIPVSAPDKLAEMIRTADENRWNLLGHYYAYSTEENKTYSTFNHYAFTDDGYKFTNYTLEELKAIAPYQELKDTVGGLGFYYGDVPLDHRFEFVDVPEHSYGEDIDFFLKTRIPLRWFPVNLLHSKEFLI